MQYKNILRLAGFPKLPFGSSTNGPVFDDFFFSHSMAKSAFHGKTGRWLSWERTCIPLTEKLKRLPSKFPSLWSDLSSMRSRARWPRLSVWRYECQQQFCPVPNCFLRRSPCQGEALRSPGSWWSSAACPHGTEPRYASCSRSKSSRARPDLLPRIWGDEAVRKPGAWFSPSKANETRTESRKNYQNLVGGFQRNAVATG